MLRRPVRQRWGYGRRYSILPEWSWHRESDPGWLESPVRAGIINEPWSTGGVDQTFENWLNASLGAAPPSICHKRLVPALSKILRALNSANAGQAAALAAYIGPAGYACQVDGKPGNYSYEGNLRSIDHAGNSALDHDLFYHESFTGGKNAYLQMLQDGGMDCLTIFTLGDEWSQLWAELLYQQQQPGSGSSNLMITAQAGGDGHNHDHPNVAVGFNADLNWMSVANASTPTSTLAFYDDLLQYPAGQLAGLVPTSGSTWANSTATAGIAISTTVLWIDRLPSLYSVSTSPTTAAARFGLEPTFSELRRRGLVLFLDDRPFQVGPVARWSVSGGTASGYMGLMDCNLGTYTINKITAGSAAVLASTPPRSRRRNGTTCTCWPSTTARAAST